MSPIAFRRKSVRSAKTIGEQFEGARAHLKTSIADVEKATHVRAKYLRALETNSFDELPELVYTLGFVRRYAQFLGIDPQLAMNEYRGERLAAHKLGWSRKIEALPAQFAASQTVQEPSFIITPKLFWFSASFASVVLVAGYLWYQVHGFMAAPNLQLAQAATPEMTVSSPSIEITGQTDGYAEVTINAEPVSLDPEGHFTQEVRLEQGLNTIEVAAKNRLNKETKKQIKVLATFEPSADLGTQAQ